MSQGWRSELTLGRINYRINVERTYSSLPEMWSVSPPRVGTVPVADIVDWDPLIAKHNDEFITQQSQDPASTIANHFNSLYFCTLAEVDLREQVFEHKLITLDNLNIQRQHSSPFMGTTYNIDAGGMVDEYIIIARRPLFDTSLPANGVPKPIPQDFGLISGFDTPMRDILFAERRRYQPDSRFVATQPIEAGSTYGDLGSPAENPQDATTLRYPSLTLVDSNSWGDTQLPIQGPTLYVYRYVRVYAADRTVQATGTTGGVYPNNSGFDQAIAYNYAYNEMKLEMVFPAISIVLEGTQKTADIGELAVAYTPDLLRRNQLQREIPRNPNPPPYRPNVDEA